MTWLILVSSFMGGGFLSLSWVAKDMKFPHARGLFVCGMCFACVAVMTAVMG